MHRAAPRVKSDEARRSHPLSATLDHEGVQSKLNLVSCLIQQHVVILLFRPVMFHDVHLFSTCSDLHQMRRILDCRPYLHFVTGILFASDRVVHSDGSAFETSLVEALQRWFPVASMVGLSLTSTSQDESPGPSELPASWFSPACNSQKCPEWPLHRNLLALASPLQEPGEPPGPHPMSLMSARSCPRRPQRCPSARACCFLWSWPEWPSQLVTPPPP